MLAEFDRVNGTLDEKVADAADKAGEVMGMGLGKVHEHGKRAFDVMQGVADWMGGKYDGAIKTVKEALGVGEPESSVQGGGDRSHDPRDNPNRNGPR